MKKKEPITVIPEAYLKTLPFNQVYAHREKNWRICEGKPWMSARHEKAWNEFSKAKKLIKHFEITFSVSEENALMRQKTDFTYNDCFPE